MRSVLILSAVLYISLVFLTFSSVFALTTPSFPTCLNPQGVIKVQYNSGIHGIAGNSNEYKGSDTVYRLSNDTFSQCFCSENGEGIQTNWWKVSSLSDSEVQILRNLGWTYIPNGALWGLEEASYMAQSSQYACGGSSNTGGSVLGASTDVLSLASSGNSAFLYASTFIGVVFVLSGIILQFRQKRD